MKKLTLALVGSGPVAAALEVVTVLEGAAIFSSFFLKEPNFPQKGSSLSTSLSNRRAGHKVAVAASAHSTILLARCPQQASLARRVRSCYYGISRGLQIA